MMALDKDTYDDVCGWLVDIEESGHEFSSQRAADFIRETRARVDRYGQGVILSDKQLEWLERLHQEATQ